MSSIAKNTLNTPCLVPRRLSFDENVRAKEGGKEKNKETIRTLFLFKLQLVYLQDTLYTVL